MGSCVSSVQKGTPESAMKLGLSFGSKKDKLVIPESPIKEKQPIADPQIKTFGDFGSKDETFFDSRPWLDSDCEDDYYSVNGDFTPSRGNTPVHHSFTPSRGSTPVHHNVTASTLQANKTTSESGPPGAKPEPSPTGKKRLSELFKDSIREDQDVDELHTSGNQNIANGKVEAKPTIHDVLPKSANHTTRPYLSGTNSVCSSERTANGDALIEKEKSIKSVQCCLPSLVSCRSFRERKKMSPAIAVNDKA